MLLQLRGRNGQNHRPGWLERRQMCRGLCRDKGWRALEWGQIVSIHSVKYEQRSWWIDHETTHPLPFHRSCLSLHAPASLYPHICFDKCSWGGKHWTHMCHSGQLRLEMCFEESFFPFPLPPFFSSLLVPSFSSPYPSTSSLSPFFFLPSFFSLFHSITLNTIVWKTVVEEKCQEVQMQIWYIWPFFSSEQ